jgi:hypothetical protein
VNTSTRNVMKATIQTGTLTNLSCAAAPALMGVAERGDPTLPINAISHVAWGDRDSPRAELSWHDTAVGLRVNQAACSFWAWLHLALLPRGQRSLTRVVTQAGAISLVAYVTDYHVVPRLFTPGFEKCCLARHFSLFMLRLRLDLRWEACWIDPS